MTSLKSLDPDYSSKNHVRKFLRALPLRWRAMMTAIEEAKYLATLPLGNLKFYEKVLDNDGVTSKTTKEKENEELLKFYKDFTKTFKRKTSLENKNSKLSSKINDLEIEVKKHASNIEVVEPCKKCEVLTKEVDSLKCNISKLQDEALNFSKFKSSSIALDDILSHQKLFQDKEGLGFSKNDKATSIGYDFEACIKHMIGNRRLFTSYKAYDGGHVVFGRNLKGKVIGGGNSHDSITITNVEHVSGLAFNLINVGQLCETLA
ncbi:hypothetical protein Tco_1420276 [Tanacetum coccineum]